MGGVVSRRGLYHPKPHQKFKKYINIFHLLIKISASFTKDLIHNTVYLILYVFCSSPENLKIKFIRNVKKQQEKINWLVAALV